ncbi:MAG TPA: hypothetical protein VK697_00750, partial [Methylomirabilota bacterium]|nr:hypothetical protein [Methylomirabilota bacterium]
NAIIPLKERVADKYYDPIQIVWRKLSGKGSADGGQADSGAPVFPGRPERAATADTEAPAKAAPAPPAGDESTNGDPD